MRSAHTIMTTRYYTCIYDGIEDFGGGSVPKWYSYGD